MSPELTREQEMFIEREITELARFLRAAGLPKLQVDISLTVLYDDLMSLFEVGCQVLEVERGSFLIHWQRKG